MKKIAIAIVLFLLSVVVHAAEPQVLAKGESIVIRTEYEIGDVAISNPSVADYIVHEGRHQIYLNALVEGYTTLTLWDKGGAEKDSVPIHVYTVTLKGILDEAKRIFGGLPSIRFQIQNDNVLMTGEAPSPREFERLKQFGQKYSSIINEVVLAQPVATTIAQTLVDAIDVPGVRVRRIRDHFVLEGTVYSESQSKRAFEIAKLYDPEVLNLLDVHPSDRVPGKQDMVQLDLYFMEIQKSALKSFGIQWAPGSFPASSNANGSIGGGGGGDGLGLGGLGKDMVGFVLNLLPKIRFVSEHGLGRVLENPTLFVKSGDQSQFFSGVEVPYYSQQSIEFKKIGIQVTAEPIASGGDVDLKLNATLSSPSPDIAGGINTNTVTTTSYVHAGEAVVLGGIVRGNDVKTYNRVPKGMDQSTALFSLFLSKDFQKNNSEFIIFAVPHINEPKKADVFEQQWAERGRELLLADEKPAEPAKAKKPRPRRWR